MRKNIDGLQYLRGIAALMVVGHHARHHFNDIESWTTVGARGVDIFFVISGFIMAYTTASTATAWWDWRAPVQFLARRTVRIVPLYWIALLYASFSVWASWVLASDSLKELYWNWNFHLTGVAKDLLFIPHESFSHPGNWWPILVPGWTLNYEMFFYALFAGCLLFSRYKTLMILTTLISLTGLGFFAPSDSGIFFFYTRPILLEFGLGILLYAVYSNAKSFNLSCIGVASIIGLGFIALVIGSDSGHKTLTAIGATLLVWAFLYIQWPRARILKLVGDASYSIYIFHTAIAFDVTRWLMGFVAGEQFPRNALSIVAVLTAYLVVSTVIGIVLHFGLEKPLLNAFKPRSPVLSPATAAQLHRS